MSFDQRSRLKKWIESGEAQLFPLTFPQRELWEASPLPVTDPANHICCLIEVHGLLTERDCRAAVQRVADRQEVLRLSFLPGKERPLQMIRKNCEANVVFREVAPADGAPERIEELVTEIFSEPFDLLQGPLYRMVDLRRNPDDHVLAFAIHHAIADGWSLGVFMQDLFAAYVQELMGTPDPLPPVPLSYTSWGAAERAFWQPALLEQRAEFWKTTLAATRRIWHSPITPGTPRRWLSKIPATQAGEIQELARRNGATLFSALLAAFQIAFSKWTGREDVLVGAPVANRTRQTVRETMGYYASIVPLRGQVDASRLIADHLRAVHQRTMDSFANAMPFVEMAAALGEHPTPGFNPLFEVRFALQNHPMPEVAAPNLSARLSMRSTGTPRFQLACEITEERAGSEVAWLFRENLFSQRDIEDLDGIFQRVLAGICRSPAGRISEVLN
ncbi:MAG TPA: condensation domain-containing protein [Chthoniobacterales bacterium]